MEPVQMSLLVKRRRNAVSPDELLIDITSRAAARSEALAGDLHRALGVSQTSPDAPTAPQEALPRKRCRFVLVNRTAAPTSGQPAADGVVALPALELWHTAGLVPASRVASSSPAALEAQQQQAVAGAASGAGSPAAVPNQQVYEAMVQQYLHDQQQQQPNEAAAMQQQQQRPHAFKRPGKRAHLAPPATASSPQEHTAAANEVQQRQQQHLPAYVVPAMLQQYGQLEPGKAPQQQDQQQPAGTTAAPPPGAAAAAASPPADGVQHTMPQEEGCSADGPEYIYDTYVAVGPDGSTGSAWQWYTPLQQQEQEQEQQQEHSEQQQQDQHPEENMDHVEYEDPPPWQYQGVPVIQLWEEDLPQLWLDGAGGAAAADAAAAAAADADDADSDDSNAEGHYLNSYADEEDGSYQDSLDDAAADDNDRYGGRHDVTNVSGVEWWEPRGAHGNSSRPYGPRWNVEQMGPGGSGGGGDSDGEEEYGPEDGVSSGDADDVAAGLDPAHGPAWLRRHCPGYDVAGGSAADSAGAVWRAVLAQQYAPAAALGEPDQDGAGSDMD